MIKKSHLISTVGAIAGASFALSTFAADVNADPFQADDLNTGYLTGQAGFGDNEGNCGEGNCGEGEGEGNCGEGNCGEGNCGEGNCGEGDEGEGSCGEGSCGTA